MTLYSTKCALIRAVLITPLALSWNASLPQVAAKIAQASLSSVIGTWKGESICVGDHPACKDEEVVYRIEAVTSKPEFVTLLADKVVDGSESRWAGWSFNTTKLRARSRASSRGGRLTGYGNSRSHQTVWTARSCCCRINRLRAA